MPEPKVSLQPDGWYVAEHDSMPGFGALGRSEAEAIEAFYVIFAWTYDTAHA